MKPYLVLFAPVIALAFASCGGGTADFDHPPDLTDGTQEKWVSNEKSECAEIDTASLEVETKEEEIEDNTGTKFKGKVWTGAGGRCFSRDIKTLWQISQTPDFVHWKDPRSKFKDEDFKQLDRDDQDGTLFLFESFYHYEFPCMGFGEQACKTWMEWKHFLKAGSVNAPELVLIHYKKRKGSPISHWQGSIRLRRVTADITSVTIVDRLAAPRAPADPSEKDREIKTVRDFMDTFKNATKLNESLVK
jgi:hypothetical protein